MERLQGPASAFAKTVPSDLTDFALKVVDPATQNLVGTFNAPVLAAITSPNITNQSLYQRVLTDFAVHVTNLTTHQPILHFRAPIIARFTMTGLLKGSRYLNMNPSGQVAVSPIGPRIHGMGLTHVVLALGLGWIVTAPEGQ